MHYKCYYYSGKTTKNIVDMWLFTNQVYMVHDNFNQMLNFHYLIIFIFVTVEKFIRKLYSPNAVSSFMNIFPNARWSLWVHAFNSICESYYSSKKNKNRTDKWYQLIVLIDSTPLKKLYHILCRILLQTFDIKHNYGQSLNVPAKEHICICIIIKKGSLLA